jgi:hypothetical protein
LSDTGLPEALAALRGCMAMRFIVDDALTVAFHAAGREARLRIDGEGVLERGGGAHRFSPDADPAGLGPVLALMHRRVADVTLDAGGRLELSFDGGATLAVLPHEHAVSWRVEAAGGASAACLAEGKVVWQ